MKIYSVLFLSVIVWVTACKADPMANLPAFNILLPDSLTVFNTSDIPDGKTIVLIRFDAYCKDCQEETDSLLKNMDAVKEARFYFVTTEPFSQVREFNEFYRLAEYPNVVIGQDYGRFFPKHFKSHSTPFVAIYDRRKNLVGIYDGKPATSELIGSIASVK